MAEIAHLIEGLSKRAAATEAQVAAAEQFFAGKLPLDYIQFLQIANGGEGFIGEEYVVLWGVEELVDLNRGYEVEQSAPGLLVFGSNGGGEAFGFDTCSPDRPVVQIPFIGMNWEDAWSKGNSFSNFLRQLRKGIQ
jgi:hypothetical protein